MEFFVYILFSSSLDKFYIGHTNDLDRRVYEHNLGHEKFTSLGRLK
jgi:putative endonuclease